jgi:putative tryptophan/tyrosine transport system substrate-binding protein
MRRREFIALAGGAAVWPVVARAQQPPKRVRRVGVIMANAESDPETQSRVAAFRQGLEQLGWKEGRDVRMDYRYAYDDADRVRRFAAEIVALQPDVILAVTGGVAAAVQRETLTTPIVFVVVPDPVRSGLVGPPRVL